MQTGCDSRRAWQWDSVEKAAEISSIDAQQVAHDSQAVTQGCSRTVGLLWGSSGVLVLGKEVRGACVGDNRLG